MRATAGALAASMPKLQFASRARSRNTAPASERATDSGVSSSGSPSGCSTTTASPSTASGSRLVASRRASGQDASTRSTRSAAPATTWSQPSSTSRKPCSFRASITAWSGPLEALSRPSASATAAGTAV